MSFSSLGNLAAGGSGVGGAGAANGTPGGDAHLAFDVEGGGGGGSGGNGQFNLDGNTAGLENAVDTGSNAALVANTSPPAATNAHTSNVRGVDREHSTLHATHQPQHHHTSHLNHHTTHHENASTDVLNVAVNSTPSFLARFDATSLYLHFQSISTFGLLSLNYPPLYRSFTLNFAWANLIVPLQMFRTSVRELSKRDSTTEPGMTGIALYAIGLKVDPQDISTIVYFVFMGVCAIFLGLFAISGLVLQVFIWISKSPEKKEVWISRRRSWHYATSNNSLRLINLALGTLATFGFWQWTRGGTSSIRAIISAVIFFVIISSLGIITFVVIRLSRREGGVQQLYSPDTPIAKKFGSLYNTLHDNRVFFLIPLSGLVILRSAIIGFGQKSGLVQSALLIFLESSMFVGLFVYRPYYSLGYNRVNYLIKGIGVLLSLLVLPFAEEIHLPNTTANSLAIVIIILQSLLALILIALTVLKLGWGTLWFRKKHHAFQKTTKRSLSLSFKKRNKEILPEASPNPSLEISAPRT